MRISVISDDLTGASECGGQLVQYGLKVSVLLQHNTTDSEEKEALIFNTDSRSVPGEEAYKRVKSVCEWIKNKKFDVVYKKIDSTMRGNIGQEINALYDVFQPDFVFIAPANPKNGRKVINGIHYLNGNKLHETEIANDPKTPVTDSRIDVLIKNQSKRQVGHLSHRDIKQDDQFIFQKLQSFKDQHIPYVTVDSAHESDFERLIEVINKTGFDVIWSGSSGLISYLPKAYGLKQINKIFTLPKNENPVLFVIGSVSDAGREQLNQLLLHRNVVGLEMQTTQVIKGNVSKRNELNSLATRAAAAFQNGKSVALFSSKTVKETQEIGENKGLNAIEISNMISKALGELAVYLINHCNIRHLFLTGGDTAQQVFEQLKINEFLIIDEVEPGIPLGQLDDIRQFLVVTKAGGLGSKLAMIKALFKLHGKVSSDEIYCSNSLG